MRLIDIGLVALTRRGPSGAPTVSGVPESNPVINGLALVAVGAGSAIVTSMLLGRKSRNAYNNGFALGWTSGALAVLDHPDLFDSCERKNLADVEEGVIGPEGAAELQRYYQRRIESEER